MLSIYSVYTTSEAHAVSTTKGDVSRIRVFADNSIKTVYEFIEDFEITSSWWGTNCQRAKQLHDHRVSVDIRSHTEHVNFI